MTDRPIAAWFERRGVIAAVLALGPIAVVLLLRLPLINQLEYADAWFYSGYGWTPKHHFGDFGFNYYAVRFSAVLPIGAFEKAFGVQAGYVLLRYLLAVATGLSLFVLVRRFSTTPVALASVLLLYLNPFFSRMLLWDYSLFVVVSAGLIGVTLWWWGEGRHWAWTALAGAALACALFAHAGFGTALAAFAAIELAAAVRGGWAGVKALALRAGVALAASVAVLATGWLAYCALIGFFDPYEMLRPVVALFHDNDGVMAPYVQPVDRWLLHSPRLWVPVVMSVALIATLGRDFLGTGIVARIAQFCVAYTLFIWIMRFSVTSAFIEGWFYYHMTVVATAPALAVLLHTLAARRALSVVPASLLVAAVTAVVIRWLPWGVSEFYEALTEDSAFIVAALIITLAGAALLAARRRSVLGGALVAFVLGSTVMAYSTDPLDGRGGTGLFAHSGDRDWVGYAAGHELAELIRDYERDGASVLLWYPTQSGYVNIAWVDLPQHGQTVQELGAPHSMDTLAPLGVFRLNAPYTYVLVMSTDAGDLTAARDEARTNGFGTEIVERGRLADGHLPYALLRLTSRP